MVNICMSHAPVRWYRYCGATAFVRSGDSPRIVHLGVDYPITDIDAFCDAAQECVPDFHLTDRMAVVMVCCRRQQLLWVSARANVGAVHPRTAEALIRRGLARVCSSTPPVMYLTHVGDALVDWSS